MSSPRQRIEALEHLDMVLPELARRHADVTRTYVFGEPVTFFVTSTHPGHDWDILKDIIPAYLDHGVTPPYVALKAIDQAEPEAS